MAYQQECEEILRKKTYEDIHLRIRASKTKPFPDRGVSMLLDTVRLDPNDSDLAHLLSHGPYGGARL